MVDSPWSVMETWEYTGLRAGEEGEEGAAWESENL